jgi:hypothetical protein
LTSNTPYTYNHNVFDILLAKAKKANILSFKCYFHTITIKHNQYFPQPQTEQQHNYIYNHLTNYLATFNFQYLATVEFSENVGYHIHVLTIQKTIPAQKEYNYHTSHYNNYSIQRAIKYIAKNTNYTKHYFYNSTTSSFYNKQFKQDSINVIESNTYTLAIQPQQQPTRYTQPKRKENKVYTPLIVSNCISKRKTNTIYTYKPTKRKEMTIQKTRYP